MATFALLALYAWPPIVLLAFALLSPRRAVIFGYVAGWLFLPVYPIVKLNGLPDLTKVTAASFGVLLGIALFDRRALLALRPKWFDLPMLAWCVSPMFTSLYNELGWWDAGSNVVLQAGTWGIPYVAGRIYFKELEAFKELAVGIIVGAVAYLPLMWLEVAISPQLHKIVYGRHASDFVHAVRWGGYRPSVFMQTGLALAMYMTTATMAAVWLYASNTLRSWKGMPLLPLVAFLFVSSIFCKTMAATAFLFIGLASLFWIRFAKNGLPLLVLAAIPPTYMYLRAKEIVPTEVIVEKFSHFTNPERLRSLEVRLEAEDKLNRKSLQVDYVNDEELEPYVPPVPHSPWLGWGRWAPSDMYNRTPWRVYRMWEKEVDGMTKIVVQDAAPTDGLWIITMGQYGILGISLLTLTILMPALVMWRRIPLRFWGHPAVAPVASMAILLMLHMSDNLLNGMINPIFMLALGGVSAIGPSVRKVFKQ
ncbi:MAG TPA: hypothetical protein VF796_22745, partial [Humisphaera sp.]